MIRIDELKRTVSKAAVIVACALLPAISSASQDMDAMKAGTTAMTSAQASGGRVYVVNGEVFVAQGKNPAHRVTENEAIVSNTMVSTGANSAALLKFDDGQVVILQSNSAFQVREYRYDAKRIENSNIVFSMLKGGMRFATGLIGKLRKQAFRLATPNATIGIRGTDFMVAMADKSMYSQVLAGKITMTNAAGMKIVSAGQSAVVTSSKALASIVSAAPVPPGTFNELQSIPVDPSAIPPLAPVPAAAAPVAAAVEAAGAATEAGAAAGATAGIAGGLMAGAAGAESSPPPEEPAAAPEAAAPAPEPAKAPEENKMAAEGEKSGVGITGKIGTLGLGAELDIAFSDSFGARLGYNNYKYKHNTDISSVNYDAELQLRTVSILGDWYPFSGGFRASAGVMYNDNQSHYTGVPTGGAYDINGVTYNASDIGSLNGTLTFDNIAPYLGIGWGNPVHSGKGWGMVVDIGVLFQGSPMTSLTATCTSPIPTVCTSLQSDVAAENAQLQSDVSKYKYWPVGSIGISYQW
ncbi:MAG TPA: FecR family protein [Gallionella sp.]|nr:FecR family protein [Gallionella sp.]